jgi:hypothetical protein
MTIGANSALAQGKAALAREAAEQLIRRFSKEVADEGVEKLTVRVQSVLANSGDDVLEVIQKGGPRALRILEDSRVLFESEWFVNSEKKLAKR